MTKAPKQLSNSFSTGGGGVLFEAHVQAAFVALMLTGGFAPCLPCRPITKIMLQGKHAGYDTDDLIVFVEMGDERGQHTLLGQVKHSIGITAGDAAFGEVIQAAWNDFNNPKLFTRNRDVIALITGPLCATDIAHARPLLERARAFEDHEEFFRVTELARFASDGQRAKLKAFREKLKRANHDEPVAEQDIFDFLKHFHLLGFDLDLKAGVALSLLHSLIRSQSQESVQAVWAMLVEEVQSANKHAGTLTSESVSENLRVALAKPPERSIPPEYTVAGGGASPSGWGALTYATEVAKANLLGSWDDECEADRVIAGQVAGEEFSSWLRKLREVLQEPEPPLALKNGKWRVVDRLPAWHALGPRLFDDDLDTLKSCALTVLGESDPQFELPREERYAASIQGKELKHSRRLRKGISESLALLGSHPEAMTHASVGKSEATANASVRTLLDGADWLRWASVNDQLPLLAEAAPTVFLAAVEKGLNSEPCPFDEVFAQESGGGIMGRNYMTGLLWALETLAWDPECFMPAVVCLGELAARDPGGQWGNRPWSSLTTIFLPWLPQTRAPVAKRLAAIRALLGELPDVGWNLLLSLLPSRTSASSGSRKPAWRQVLPDDWTDYVNKSEYREQVEAYSDMVVDTAMSSKAKLIELLKHFATLYPAARRRLLEYLKSEAVVELPERDRLPIWSQITGLVTEHRRFADAAWALSPSVVDDLAELADKLAPDSPAARYQRLFAGQGFDLLEEEGSFEEQLRELEGRRQRAIEEVAAHGGTAAILAFAETVESPWHVGLSFAVVADEGADEEILPSMLQSDKKSLAEFAAGFAEGRFRKHGWEWVDRVSALGWTHEQIALVLALLPFDSETWRRSELLLGEDDSLYWRKTHASSAGTAAELQQAVGRLIQVDRPLAAVRCLSKMIRDEVSFNTSSAVDALIALLASQKEWQPGQAYEVVEIIKALQNDSSTDPHDLFRVEWAYLPLLDEHYGASPKQLWHRLANEPRFFCELIRLIFRSKKEERRAEEPTEEARNIAANAYRLLREWRFPPGCQEDGSYDGEALAAWLESVKKECSDTGHLEIAMTVVGGALVYAPPDADGLWINRQAATALNGKDAGDIRDGFFTELLNSRGAYTVDPTGRPERELAAKYRLQAEDVENAGYHRLAATVRELADWYAGEADKGWPGDRLDR